MHTTQHRLNLSANTARRPSPALWADCPWFDILEGVTEGYQHWCDFDNLPITPPTTEGNFGQYKAFTSTGGTMVDGATLGGALTIASDGDNEGASLGQTVQPVQISRSHGKLWFEARVKTSTIADTKHGIFLGLIDAAALSATVPIAADGTLADENFVGFHRLEGDGDKVDCVYKANGVTQVTVEADAVTLVADTYVKLGMVWDPDDDYKLSFYSNGVLLDTYTMATTDGDDFPNDVKLGLVFAVLNATGSTPGSSTIDWWRLAQLHI